MFSALDANSESCQTAIDERNRDKTAFVSYHGLPRLECMPIGQKDALPTFLQAMNVIFPWTGGSLPFSTLNMWSSSPESRASTLLRSKRY